MDLKLTDGDLTFSQGDLVTTSGIDETAQRIAVNLRTVMGECFVDETIGIPYLEQVFSKTSSIEVVTALFRSAILSDPDVVELRDFQFTFDAQSRTLSIFFIALTVENEIVTFPEFIINV